MFSEPTHRQEPNGLTEDLFKPLLPHVDFEEQIEKLKVVERIQEIRKKTGVSRKDLAARIGETEAFIEKLENKKAVSLDLNLLVRIANALNCRLEINFCHPDNLR